MKYLMFSFLMLISINVFAIDLPRKHQTIGYLLEWKKSIKSQNIIEKTLTLTVTNHWMFSNQQLYRFVSKDRNTGEIIEFELLIGKDKQLEAVFVPFEYTDVQNLFIQDVSAWLGVKLNSKEFRYRENTIKYYDEFNQYVYSLRLDEKLEKNIKKIDGANEELILSVLDEINFDSVDGMDYLEISNSYLEGRELTNLKTNMVVRLEGKGESNTELNTSKYEVATTLRKYSDKDLLDLLNDFIDENIFIMLNADSLDDMDEILGIIFYLDEDIIYKKLKNKKLSLPKIVSHMNFNKGFISGAKVNVYNMLGRFVEDEGGLETAFKKINERSSTKVDEVYRNYVVDELRNNFSMSLFERFYQTFYQENISKRSFSALFFLVSDVRVANENFDDNDIEQLRRVLKYNSKYNRAMLSEDVDLELLDSKLLKLAEYYASFNDTKRKHYKNYIILVVEYAYSQNKISDEELKSWILITRFQKLNELLGKENKNIDIDDYSILEIKDKWPDLTGVEKSNILKDILLSYEVNYWMAELLNSNMNNSNRVKIILERLGEGVTEFPENKDILIEFLLNNERFTYRKIITKHLGEEFVDIHAPEPIE